MSPIDPRTIAFEKFLASSREQFFVPRPEPVVSAVAIAAAEAGLGVTLPPSYIAFLRLCGAGEWCGEEIAHPGELYAFDADCGAQEGFIALVHNVLGCGDFVTIDPADAASDGERPLYYASHDPFGYAPIARSFEQWARRRVADEIGNECIYDDVAGTLEAEWSRHRKSAAKRWWQFWR